jgi:precorrin isomerase
MLPIEDWKMVMAIGNALTALLTQGTCVEDTADSEELMNGMPKGM